MANIITYAENFLHTFEESPFTEVDSLLLSYLSYIHFPTEPEAVNTFEGVTIRELFKAEYFREMFSGLKAGLSMKNLFANCSASPRFRDVKVFAYRFQTDDELDKQFAAVSFDLGDSIYIAFRGTDSTLTGWQEDFNMSIDYPIPSQKEAFAYITDIALHTDKPLMTGGHSKGGNLAVFAAASAEGFIQDRITDIYSHDGPGFYSSRLEETGFVNIRSRIHKTIPQFSVVGMLLDNENECKIIRSSENGLNQHDPLSWEIVDNKFDCLDELKQNAVLISSTLNEWISGLTDEEKRKISVEFFGVLERTGVSTLNEIQNDKIHKIPLIIKEMAALDSETRSFFMKILGELFAKGAKNFSDMLTPDRAIEKTSDKNAEKSLPEPVEGK
ncbi:MAG: DUF2974 domain-containing protein [Clostridia bacterium]|nr:DUF2974 domain-containing protein [Clostridia bacterium]